MRYFLIFLLIVFGVVGLFECLDFVQKYLAQTSKDPLVVLWRSTRHIYQFFPYLLFTVFGYSLHRLMQTREFQTLHYLGFGWRVWVITATLLVGGFFILFYFWFTPLQRLALDHSQKPIVAIQSVLLAPTGVWFLDQSSPGKTRFIKASSYDQKTQKLKDVYTFTVFDIQSDAPHAPALIEFVSSLPIKEKTLVNSTQDYFPYVNITDKIEVLKRMGFSPVEYQVIQHRLWFLPLYFFGLALLAFLLAYSIQSTALFSLIILGTTIGLFFVYEMVMSFVLAEKIALLPALVSLLIGLYTLCGGCYVAFVRPR